MTKQKEETFESIVENFHPTRRLEDYQVVREYMKKQGLDYSKYKSIFTVKDSVSSDEGDIIHVKAYLQPDAPANARAEVIEFDAQPSDFGFAKKSELLICTLEEGIVNTKTRRVEQGIFLFKVTVKTEAKNLWLFWLNGRIYYMDTKYRSFHTDCLSGFSEIEEFSDFKRQFPKRIHITAYDYSQLQKKELVKSAYHANEGFLAPPINAK